MKVHHVSPPVVADVTKRSWKAMDELREAHQQSQTLGF